MVFNIHLTNPPEGGSATAQVLVGTTTYDVAINAAGDGVLSIPFSDNDVYNDAYNDADSFTATVTGVTGGNYEAFQPGATATATITEVIDTTSAVITTSDVPRDRQRSGVQHPPDQSTRGVRSATAQVLVGTTTYDVAINAAGDGVLSIPFSDNDVYNDADSFTATVTGVTGGNYEAFQPGATATATITEVIDTTSAVITTSDVPETGSAVVFNIHLTNPPEGGSATAQVLVGTTTYDVAINAAGDGVLSIPFSDNDVYNDADSFTATVTGVTGGNYEAFQPGATATATITEVIDTTSAVITTSDVPETGSAVVLQHPPDQSTRGWVGHGPGAGWHNHLRRGDQCGWRRCTEHSILRQRRLQRRRQLHRHGDRRDRRQLRSLPAGCDSHGHHHRGY